MRAYLVAAVSLLAVGLVACSEGATVTPPGPETTAAPAAAPVAEAVPSVASEPVGEVATASPPPATATETEPEKEPAPLEVATETTTAEPVATASPAAETATARPEPTPSTLTLPTVEFPDDIALLGLQWGRKSPDVGELFLQRVYWNDGELVRETIFGPYLSTLPLVAAPDASSFIQTHWIDYSPLDSLWNDAPLLPSARSALSESRDGGVTWEPLVEFDGPDEAVKVLPGRNGNDRQVLIRAWSGYERTPFILWPSGETEPEGPQGYDLLPPRYWVVLDDGRLAWAFKKDNPPAFVAEWQLYRYLTVGGEDVTELVPPLLRSCWWCLMLPDGRLLWVSLIIDPETGERFGKIELPAAEVPRAEDAFWPIAVQRGPFLRVVDDLDGCLPVLADPSTDAEELACMAARVLLTDQGEAVEVEGETWHRVRTPAGIEGWADGGQLD